MFQIDLNMMPVIMQDIPYQLLYVYTKFPCCFSCSFPFGSPFWCASTLGRIAGLSRFSFQDAMLTLPELAGNPERPHCLFGMV